MTDTKKGWPEIRQNAMHAETVHLSALERGERDWTRDPEELLLEIFDESACSLIAAITGAAARYTCEHPHHADADLWKMARDAERIVANLPTRLHRFWEVHYVDGHPLALYAESMELDMAAAQADYVEILGELVRMLAPGGADELSRSGIRDTIVHGAATCLPA